MNYEEALAYIDTLNTKGIMPGLERISKLLDEMNHPEKNCNLIHVAGTNGKGSVCTYIASILQAAGYKVGRYVSPTLYDYRERIQINGEWIEKDHLTECVAHIQKAVRRMEDAGIETPTAFEAETVMGFYYFDNQKCDFVLLETGMGGRLDATNVIENPLITVITSIGMDHMAFLGNDLASIAREKGGIIKKGRPVVIDGSCREAVDVLAAICQERDCCFKITEKNALKRLQSSLNEGQFFDYRQHRNLHTIMPGTYQLDNAAVALETVDILRKIPRDRFSRQVEGLLTERLTENVIAKGIAKARWSGRFEVVCSQPLVIVDGAHNPDGIRVLLNSVRNYLEGRQLIVMMGVFADKDYKTMLKLISEISDTLIAFRPDHVRGLDAARLAAEAATWFDDVEVAKNQQEAVEKAFALCGREDVILSLGSLSTIAGLKKELEKLL